MFNMWATDIFQALFQQKHTDSNFHRVFKPLAFLEKKSEAPNKVLAEFFLYKFDSWFLMSKKRICRKKTAEPFSVFSDLGNFSSVNNLIRGATSLAKKRCERVIGGWCYWKKIVFWGGDSASKHQSLGGK